LNELRACGRACVHRVHLSFCHLWRVSSRAFASDSNASEASDPLSPASNESDVK
jgi:hypothetical protein